MQRPSKQRIHTTNQENYQYSYTVRLILLFLMIIGGCIMLRNPAWGMIEAETDKRGIDVVVMLDVSRSMQVQDISEGRERYSRLDMAKSTIERLVTDNPQNRYGLGIFAGEAQGVSPLTTDHNIFLTFLAGVDDQNLSEQGTNLQAALDRGTQRFTDPERGKLLIIMSDGGDEQELGFLSQYDGLIQDQNIIVVTAGLGTSEGGPIPMGQDPFGGVVYRQYQGETVIAGFNQEALKTLARQLDGEFIHIEDVNDANKLLNRASSLEQKAIATTGSQQRSVIRPLTYMILVLFLIYIVIYNYPKRSLYLSRPHNH